MHRAMLGVGEEEIVLRSSVEIPKGGNVTCIAWSPDAAMLAYAASGNLIYICNRETKKVHRILKNNQLEHVTSIAWTPNSTLIAAGTNKGRIMLWDAMTGRRVRSFRTQGDAVQALAWSPSGDVLASGSVNASVQLWYPESGTPIGALNDHIAAITCLAWSPDGNVLASGSADRDIHLWHRAVDTTTALRGHAGEIVALAWSPDGRAVASGSEDRTVRVWHADTGREGVVLERHVEAVVGLAYTSDGRGLVSADRSGYVATWDENWNAQAVGRLFLPTAETRVASPAFRMDELLLATGHRGGVRIWDIRSLLTTRSDHVTVHYTNARVILIGDTGVGKTGLGLVLSGQPFRPSDSTHGRNVWTFENVEVQTDDGRTELRETLLWDLAGQPGYRIIHQLHLTEVAVAVVVFDSRSETDPFAGVKYWNRALQQAQRLRGLTVPSVRKLLVAGRTDVGGIGVSPGRIQRLVAEMGFEDYHATSAKERRGIDDLIQAIKGTIDWEMLPRGSTPLLFQRIKEYILARKEAGGLLVNADELRSGFPPQGANAEDAGWRADFDTCLRLMEARGLVKRLSFGNYVLLQPEILDAYAAALVNAARDEPDGLGSIAEDAVLAGQFYIPDEARLRDTAQERLLLIAMIEDLLRHEIALRESAADGRYLVFPAQLTREHPNLPRVSGKAVAFQFQGPVQNIYATLAVRLAHSEVFTKNEMWKDAIMYTAVSGIVGMFLNERDEGQGELILFYDDANVDSRVNFENYVEAHLKRWAIHGSVERHPIIACPNCGYEIEAEVYAAWKERGLRERLCPKCDHPIILDGVSLDTVTSRPTILTMDRSADAAREREAATSTLEGKRVARAFDVFLCYDRSDKNDTQAANEIAERLEAMTILPWHPAKEVRPGLSWQRELERQIAVAKTAAVIVGRRGLGPWQTLQTEGLVRAFVERDIPVIPVFLEDAPSSLDLPTFLQGMKSVDFRHSEPDPFEELVWGITGEQPRRAR